jgi:hypothetical protein
VRQYTKLDLLRFANFKQKNPDKKPIDLIKEYDSEYPEVSAKDKLINISKALDIHGLHKALTGKDIDKNDEFYKSWNEFNES